MKDHNSPLDAALDAGIQKLPFIKPKEPKVKNGRARPSYAAMGQMDARKTTSLGNSMNWLGQEPHAEGEQFTAYSETAQEIKIRKAAEKRARRSGKQ